MPGSFYNSERLSEVYARQYVFGSRGFYRRESLDDYVDLTEVLE